MTDDIDRMLASLRDEYAERDQREAAAHAQQARAHAHAQRERERAALLSRARRYLATLVAQSKEGRRFEDFARHYATREDAAIEVIRAQDELERAL